MCRKERASFFLSLFNLVSCSLWLLSLVTYYRVTNHPKRRGLTPQSFVLLTHMPSLLHAAPARATQRLGTIWRLGRGTIWKLSHSDTSRLNLAVAGTTAGLMLCLLHEPSPGGCLAFSQNGGCIPRASICEKGRSSCQFLKAWAQPGTASLLPY